ncbi:hypothetical protein ANCCEY_03438 [Ancylostoma ceylanicum]|uniref:Integrase zinc-binding domain-containing protein n=1 Tax=Ancylostoma ceylanicum TaxID=53326 RepID=A0A0D6LZJ6_9BILA|nr:hypothetical protein ANCCEY_03438 [Ancylostoma ceylanicum]
MATCVYVGNNNTTNLVIAKFKLPSLKTSINIPNLEMNALTLGARVANFVFSSLVSLQEIKQISFFTDSEIVLGWVKAPSDRQSVGVLVDNRLKEVRRIITDMETRDVQCLFGHIPTASNPAHCGTRRLTSAAFQKHYWWNGPESIRTNFTEQPEYESMFPLGTARAQEQESTPTPILVAKLSRTSAKTVEETTLFPLHRFSTLHKAQRVAAYVIRFIRRTLQHIPASRKEEMFQHIPALNEATSKHELTGPELREAKNCIIQDHQKTLVTEHSKKSQKDLNIQEGELGILRCFGRLQHADIPSSAVEPIYIAPKTALARLIIWEAHNQYHRSTARTMPTVRETFWIPKLRQQVSQMIKKCTSCRSLIIPYRYPSMEDLPGRRV